MLHDRQRDQAFLNGGPSCPSPTLPLSEASLVAWRWPLHSSFSVRVPQFATPYSLPRFADIQLRSNWRTVGEMKEMGSKIFLLLAFVAVGGAVALSMGPAVAHYWVPTYDGAKWGQVCLAPGTRRVTPSVCCQQSGSFCQAACDLADIDDTWKNTCRTHCQSAVAACLQRVQQLPPATGVIPGVKPPAATN